MLIYLDSVICIYAVEGTPPFQARARTRLMAMRAAGDQPVISDLTWLECRIRPIRLNDHRLSAFPDVQVEVLS